MDAAKKARRIQRTLFTKILNSFLSKVNNEEVSHEEEVVAFQLLEARMAELESANTKYLEYLLSDEGTEEDEIAGEIEAHDEYKEKYLTAKNLFLQMQSNLVVTTPTVNNPGTTHREKPFKRPMLEIPKFSGSVSGWLQFWSHFRKIHEDVDVSDEDKLAYLKQVMEKGSKAESVVEGYPTTAANYNKAFNSLKSRFGRDDLLVEFYTRELLSLVLQNATNKGKKTSISSIYDKISAHIRALETLGVTTNTCATMLYPLVESSLPEEILRTWQRSTSNAEPVVAEGAAVPDRLTRLLEFLALEVENEERINMAVNGFSIQTGADKREKNKEDKGKTVNTEVATASALLSNEVKAKKCIFCQENHENSACEKAKKVTYEVRNDTVKTNRCCFRCLKPGHKSRDCRVKLSCSWCKGRHVILMCPVINNVSENSKVNKNQPIKENKIEEKNLANFCNSPAVFLKTLRVVVYSECGERKVRAVIDEGSQRSYIRSDIAVSLGYKPIGTKEVVHSLFGGVNSKKQVHNVYKVHMKSIAGDYACNFDAMDQLVICGDIPRIKVSSWVKELEENGVSLTDLSTSDSKESIEVLIGADIAGKLVRDRRFNLENGLTVTETHLGWTVMGRNPEYARNDVVTKMYSMFVQNAEISDLWSLDVLGIGDPSQNSNRLARELKVKDNFLNTISLNKENRYSVELPWSEDHAPISMNLDCAKKRLEKIEIKLKTDGIYNDYDEVFKEWVKEDVIELLPESDSTPSGHYLPHRPVIKESSTTRIRPVFDASAREKPFPSLNQCLEKGPNLIELIPATLLRFREHEIAVMADIRKAFLQIEIREKDRDYLRFLWFVDGNLRTFRHKRLVFGLTCSPFILGAVLEFHFAKLLENLSNDMSTKWSRENIERLSKSFYVDNCVTSVSNEEILRSFMDESREIMSLTNFDLRGWEFTGDSLPNESTLVLGVLYNKSRDTISINPTVLDKKEMEMVTKRTILSTANRVFDPIGFTAPVTLLPKLLLKELWESKCAWDTPVDESTKAKFLQWCSDLDYLKEIEISRKFGNGVLSIHTFSDASTVAYGAVTFLRVENELGVELKILAAKSRIAPTKTSIPRLELLAASIGSRQTQNIVEALGYEKIPVVYWTDSTTVLAWLEQDRQWGVFVWNRVQEVRRLTSSGVWKHVPGEMNPADLPSRGCTAKKLLDSRWVEGPDWLKQDSHCWPSLPYKINEDEVNKELKKGAQITLVNISKQSEIDLTERFSSYDKMIRFYAIMVRFKNFKLKTDKYKGKQLTYKEIKETELKFMKGLQNTMFMQEKDPKLKTLPIWVDSEGLMRLKTKIVERDDDFAFRYPIVLDGKHPAVQLLVRETHENMSHAGVQTVMCHLRERFWILSMRKTVKSVITRCVVCKRHSVKPVQADPAPLPVHRVKDTAVFEVTGVDFAGPLYLRGGQKAWICLYTCAVYRAVHLELVTSLSTLAFLSSLRRFIARRGRPSIVYTDNGTNFVGAANAFKDLNWDVIAKYSSTKEIDWRFNPPTAAWWGGWWERLVGCVKVTLRKILGRACLNYDEMYTVLCDCELTINSRPLTYLSNEVDDLKALTPNMFLHGIYETGTPDIDILESMDLTSRFKYKQAIMEHLRVRFRKEYLSQLVSRKNVQEFRELKIGDIVLIGDDTHKRLDWPLARIENLIAGRDGIARVAVLRTENGVLKRPIQRLYPLEIDHDVGDNSNELRQKIVANEEVNSDSDRESSCNTKDDSPNVELKTRSGRSVRRPKRLED